MNGSVARSGESLFKYPYVRKTGMLIQTIKMIIVFKMLLFGKYFL